MHARLFPRENKFHYGGYYLALDLAKLDTCDIAINRRGFIAFHTADHGADDADGLTKMVREKLQAFNIDLQGRIVLVCMPRIGGYVFNPVSFFLCFDADDQLRAYICQVHNTFGEEHFYVCHKDDHGIISKQDVLVGQKHFHVSPFLERAGHYKFRVSYTDQKAGFWIDFYDDENRKKLITSLTGKTMPLSRQTARWMNIKYPLITLKTIGLIHWQALKIWLKKTPYISKPDQKSMRASGTNKNTVRMKPKEGKNDV